MIVEFEHGHHTLVVDAEMDADEWGKYWEIEKLSLKSGNKTRTLSYEAEKKYRNICVEALNDAVAREAGERNYWSNWSNF